MNSIQARFKLGWPGFALDVDISLPGHGVTVLFGPSGCGKTTLLRSIAGLERPPQGLLRVNGEIWQDDRIWIPTHLRSLAYVFQEASLFPHLSVMGNLQYGRQRTPLRSDGQAIDLSQAIELLGIEGLLSRKPDALSGGERQRVAIARALAVNPRLLLMDEPLAALDMQRKQEILPYLERLQQRLDIPIIYVTHAPDEVARLAQHIVVLDQGKLVASGSLSDTLTRVDLPIRLGDDLGVVIEARVGEIDRQWHLARLDFADGVFWARDQGLAIHEAARVRIPARDVSITREKPVQSSIQNILAGRIDRCVDDEHPGGVIVRVRIGDTALLARVTARAVADLALKPGDAVWVQIKSVALAR
jgi:molybdate transport system ATP-binding protein